MTLRVDARAKEGKRGGGGRGGSFNMRFREHNIRAPEQSRIFLLPRTHRISTKVHLTDTFPLIIKFVRMPLFFSLIKCERDFFSSNPTLIPS